MNKPETITFEGRFDFPFDTPMILHHMPENKIGFELMGDEARFVELLAQTPECNDFRRLGNGDWIAYSTVLDKEGTAIREIAKTIYEALKNLQTTLDALDQAKPDTE